jgi:hypothetical protein
MQARLLFVDPSWVINAEGVAAAGFETVLPSN